MAFKMYSSPMKSLFGLGKDNKEARQINRDNRREYRADKKDYRQEKRANNRQYREDMRAYEKDLAGNTSKRNFLTGDPGLTKSEGDYFRDNKADYSDFSNNPDNPQLGNKDFKRGKDRRDIIREDYLRDYAMDNIPVRGNISNKPTRPEKEKLDYDWKLGVGKNSTAYNASNPAFKMKGSAFKLRNVATKSALKTTGEQEFPEGELSAGKRGKAIKRHDQAYKRGHTEHSGSELKNTVFSDEKWNSPLEQKRKITKESKKLAKDFKKEVIKDSKEKKKSNIAVIREAKAMGYPGARADIKDERKRHRDTKKKVRGDYRDAKKLYKSGGNPPTKMEDYHTMPDGTKMKGSKHKN